MSKHTPGPWEFLQFAHRDGALAVLSHEHAPGGIALTVGGLGLEELANARLIAAAPELLAVLKEAELDCRGYDALHGWLEKATELIAKAEGEA
jgi:hypothetical protein